VLRGRKPDYRLKFLFKHALLSTFAPGKYETVQHLQKVKLCSVPLKCGKTVENTLIEVLLSFKRSTDGSGPRQETLRSVSHSAEPSRSKASGLDRIAAMVLKVLSKIETVRSGRAVYQFRTVLGDPPNLNVPRVIVDIPETGRSRFGGA